MDAGETKTSDSPRLATHCQNIKESTRRTNILSKTTTNHCIDEISLLVGWNFLFVYKINLPYGFILKL